MMACTILPHFKLRVIDLGKEVPIAQFTLNLINTNLDLYKVT